MIESRRKRRNHEALFARSGRMLKPRLQDSHVARHLGRNVASAPMDSTTMVPAGQLCSQIRHDVNLSSAT